MAHTNNVELVENGGWDERIVVCRNAPLVDTCIVITERFVVVVDTMINDVTGEALWEAASAYVSEQRLMLVVNTHADYDHVWGNQAFSARGVPIIGRHNSVPIFSQESSLATLQQFKEQEPQIFGRVTPTPPNLLFDETLTIDGGDLTLQLIAAPGHTVDHMAIFIPEIRTLLAADAAELPYPVARTPEGLPQMRASLARLAALEPETVLYCHAAGHSDAQILHGNITYFERLEAACRDALSRGALPPTLEDEALIERVGLPYAEAVPDDAVWHNVHPYYQTTGHAEQLRHMLASLR